jgi:hypothetical protein
VPAIRCELLYFIHDGLCLQFFQPFLRCWFIKACGVSFVLFEQPMDQWYLHTEFDSSISLAALGLQYQFDDAFHSQVCDLTLIESLEPLWGVGAVESNSINV